MKDKKRNCLVFLVLFICLTVCAQSSDEVKAMRNLRDYYTQNINTYDINQNMGKWDLYLKQLSEEGQFADLAAYEKKIHDNNWLSSVSFQDQQDIGFYLADTFRRLWVIANRTTVFMLPVLLSRKQPVVFISLWSGRWICRMIQNHCVNRPAGC